MPIVRLPFTQPIESRTNSTAKDSRSVNCYFETRGGDTKENVKRPGLVVQTVTAALTAGAAQGMYKCNSGYLWVVINNAVSRISTGLASVASGTLSGAVQNVYFAESANDSYLFLHNGSNGYVSTGNGSFTLIDNTSIYAVTILTGGTLYINGQATGTFSAPGAGVTATGTPVVVGGVVVGITITNPGSGYTATPTYTVSAGGGGGGAGATTLVALSGFPTGAGGLAAGAAYLDGYTIVATKIGNIYNSDIDNPNLWNPLNVTKAQADPDNIVGIVKHFNYLCVFGGWSTEFFYDAQVTPGSPLLRQDSYKNEIGCADGNSIVQFEQAVAFVGISKTHGKSVFVLDGVTPTKISTRYIDKYLNQDLVTNIQAFVFKIEGHTFYVMSMPTSDLTFVYDFDEKQWYQWTSFSSSAEHVFAIWTAVEFNTDTIGLHATNGKIYAIRPAATSDDGISIYWRVVTNNLDSGTMHRKFFKSGEVVGDKVSCTMSIRHYDNDFATASSWRTVTLNSVRAILYQLGQARRRAWEFLITDNVSLRLSAFELNEEGGEKENDPQMGGG